MIILSKSKDPLYYSQRVVERVGDSFYFTGVSTLCSYEYEPAYDKGGKRIGEIEIKWYEEILYEISDYDKDSHWYPMQVNYQLYKVYILRELKHKQSGWGPCSLRQMFEEVLHTHFENYNWHAGTTDNSNYDSGEHLVEFIAWYGQRGSIVGKPKLNKSLFENLQNYYNKYKHYDYNYEELAEKQAGNLHCWIINDSIGFIRRYFGLKSQNELTYDTMPVIMIKLIRSFINTNKSY
jgi:hypothetical protein